MRLVLFRFRLAVLCFALPFSALRFLPRREFEKDWGACERGLVGDASWRAGCFRDERSCGFVVANVSELEWKGEEGRKEGGGGGRGGGSQDSRRHLSAV